MGADWSGIDSEAIDETLATLGSRLGIPDAPTILPLPDFIRQRAAA